MATSRYYSVAGHVFEITAAEEIQPLLTNYSPFEICSSGQAKVFSLTVSQEAMSALQDITHVYTDTSDDDMPRIEVYRHAEGWLIAVSMYRESEVVCRIVSSQDFSHAIVYAATEDLRFVIDNAAMLLFAFTTAPLKTLEMHASVIRREGKGYLFLGHSGTGKSTHSRMWLSRFPDAELLNDDNPIVRIYPAAQHSAKAVVYGSPWSGKTPCYRNESAPIQAIVKLSQAPHNEVRTLRLPEAYAHVLSSSSGLKILPEMMDALYETISTLIQTVGVYGLECLPNTDAAEVCYCQTKY